MINEFTINYEELTTIYVQRGLDISLARQVARQLTDKDNLIAHTRGELGISANFIARPIQSAFSSAAAFTVGALLLLVIVLLASSKQLLLSVSTRALITLAVLGALSTMILGLHYYWLYHV